MPVYAELSGYSQLELEGKEREEDIGTEEDITTEEDIATEEEDGGIIADANRFRFTDSPSNLYPSTLG